MVGSIKSTRSDHKEAVEANTTLGAVFKALLLLFPPQLSVHEPNPVPIDRTY